LLDSGDRQAGLQRRDGTHHGGHEGVRVRARLHRAIPWLRVAVGSDRRPDTRDHGLRGRTVRRHDGVGHALEPVSVRHETVDPGRLAPCREVEALVGGRPRILHDDPAVSGDDAGPTHRPGREDPDDRPRVGRGWQQEASAQAVGGAPIPAGLAGVEGGGDRDGREEDEGESGDLEQGGSERRESSRDEGRMSRQEVPASCSCI
jgi:hypothetical protein